MRFSPGFSEKVARSRQHHVLFLFKVSCYEILTEELRRTFVAQGKFEPQQPDLPTHPEGERAARGLSEPDLWGSWAAPSKF